ncbi:MAG: hypothetical protein H0Z39_01165 [Peptococcaceae bacterium]|nr:hypothetical protein [Peptococcaceae bacterium]
MTRYDWQLGYHQGYAEGYDLGYERGYQEGKAIGYNTGLAEGLTDNLEGKSSHALLPALIHYINAGLVRVVLAGPASQDAAELCCLIGIKTEIFKVENPNNSIPSKKHSSRKKRGS